jgi:hypothetical protein
MPSLPNPRASIRKHTSFFGRDSLGFQSSESHAEDFLFDIKSTPTEGVTVKQEQVSQTPGQRCLSLICSLRVTTLVTLILSFFSMMAIFLVVLLTVFKLSFNRMEVSNTKDATQRVTRAMYDDLSGQLGNMEDYANWVCILLLLIVMEYLTQSFSHISLGLNLSCDERLYTGRSG